MTYLFRPDDLTEKGLRERKLCFIHCAIFVGKRGVASVSQLGGLSITTKNSRN